VFAGELSHTGRRLGQKVCNKRSLALSIQRLLHQLIRGRKSNGDDLLA
jgi:hypothetical protein